MSGTLGRTQSIDLNGGSLSAAAGSFTNAGTITVRNCTNYSGLYTSGGSIVNKGTVTLPAGPNCFLFGGGPFTNQGHLTVQTGALLWSAVVAFTNAGGVVANAGNLVALSAGTFTEGAGRVTGNAIQIQSGVTLDLAGSGASSFTLENARLAGNVAASQHLYFQRPVFQGQGPGGTTAVAGFTNAGTISLNDALILPPGATLTNAGRLTESAGGVLTGALTSTGVVQIPAGIPFSVSGAVTTTGTLEIGVDVASAPGFLVGSGMVALGGTLKVDTGTPPLPGKGFIVWGTAVSGTFATTRFGGHPYSVACTTASCILTAG